MTFFSRVLTLGGQLDYFAADFQHAGNKTDSLRKFLSGGTMNVDLARLLTGLARQQARHVSTRTKKHTLVFV